MTPHLSQPPLSLAQRFPQRANRWQLRTRTLHLTTCPAVMGIVNVTPDSFSDGGKFYAPQLALERALQMARAGADLLDIGGESTRPYSEPVSVEEELRRVVPVIEQLTRMTSIPVSIDTSKAQVAEAALNAGAEIINDVTGLQGDPQMLAVAQRSGAGVCVMHMQGTPQTMQDDPHYDDVVTDVLAYLLDRRDALVRSGINVEKICLDPGIGFGKTHQHNLTLLANCWRFHETACPLLVGHSRKGFIAKVLGDKQADRTAGTVGVSLALAAQGVQVLRVHDAAAVSEALRFYVAAGGVDGQALQLPPG